jgi:hypothetical protein
VVRASTSLPEALQSFKSPPKIGKVGINPPKIHHPPVPSSLRINMFFMYS